MGPNRPKFNLPGYGWITAAFAKTNGNRYLT